MSEKRINIDEYDIIEYPKTNIYIVENILENEFCEEIINTIDVLPLKKLSYNSANNVECNFFVLDDYININNDSVYYFSTNEDEIETILKKINNKENIYMNKLNGISSDTIKQQNDKLNKKMEILQNLFNTINNKIKFDHTHFAYRKMYGPTRLHTDGILDVYEDNVHFLKENRLNDYRMVRNCSVVFTLNDDYEGGVFNFPQQEVSVKLKKGSVIVFPPYWTHPHQVSKLENNTFRYTVNTWGVHPDLYGGPRMGPDSNLHWYNMGQIVL
jgi:uncharacterized protein YukE